MKNAIKKSALIVWSIAWIIGAATIQLTDDIMDEGQKSFRVVTPGATYFYHKEGAGFSSLVDKAGKDWISYNSSSGSSGKYRGIPNMVWKSPEADNRAFHPGHTGSWGSTTTLESKSSGKVTIKSVAKVNGWTCYWDFYPSHATMRLTEKPAGATYWFLYEGTPNGTFSTSTNYMMRSDSKTRMPLGQMFMGEDIKPETGTNHEWAYFGDTNVKRGLLLIVHKDDSQNDYYKPMSPMTVFGFGRPRSLVECPNTFSIALVETAEWSAISAIAKSIVEGDAVSALQKAEFTVAQTQSRLSALRLFDISGRQLGHFFTGSLAGHLANRSATTGIYIATIPGKSTPPQQSRCIWIKR